MLKFIPALMAVAGLFSCGVSAQARGQRMVTLSPGLHRLDIGALEARLGAFEAVTVTMPPPRSRAVLYLDGSPVAGYRMLSRGQLERVWVFVPEGAPVSAGMLALAPKPPSGGRGAFGISKPLSGGRGASGTPEGRPRIRCINPVFDVNNSAK